MWLYQHSARCSVALQLFLDDNPDYWCFVPTKCIEVNLLNGEVYRTPSIRSHIPITPTIAWARSDEQVRWLVENVPRPPTGFDFSIGQRQQQAHFFKLLQDRVVPSDNVNLYNADIVALSRQPSSTDPTDFYTMDYLSHSSAQSLIRTLLPTDRITLYHPCRMQTE